MGRSSINALLLIRKSWCMKNNHKCESMFLAQAWFENNERGWILNINRTATEEDLEDNHHLEEVGQAICQIAVNIKFCPYCGCQLNTSKDDVVPKFILYDFSTWR